jgi:tyrosine-protein phosphatase SIW14
MRTHPARPALLQLLASACLFHSLLSAATATPPPAHIHNFGQVDSTLFRGAEPSPAGLNDLRAMGIKLVIDLRKEGAGRDAEKQAVEALGMKYVNVGLKAWKAPSEDNIRQVLTLISEAGNDPVFVHCLRGKDRTGTVIACYRIQHDGWNNQRALAEAHEFGMSAAERGMRSFILHFKPLPALFPAPVSP